MICLIFFSVLNLTHEREVNMIRRQKLNEGEIISLTYDFMFTSIFNKEENIDILEEFVSFYLDIDLNDVKGNLKLVSRELELESKKEAGKTVDLLLDYKGKKINIELSNNMSKGVTERNIVFVCRVHGGQLKYGDIHYKGIEQTIQINLLGYKRNKGVVKERYSLRNEKRESLSDRLIIDIIDMELGSELWYIEPTNKMYSWCKLFMSKNETELEESRKYIMGRESGEKLDKEIKKLSQEDEMIYLYTKLSKEELEKNTLILEAEERGAYENKKDVVKELSKMNMSLEQISQVTKLSITEIEEIKKEIF